jgi:hypothetical protein
MNRSRCRALLCLVMLTTFVVTVAGCASSAPPASRTSAAPRVRCLDDGGRDRPGETRPLFFLFCIQSQ